MYDHLRHNTMSMNVGFQLDHREVPGIVALSEHRTFMLRCGFGFANMLLGTPSWLPQFAEEFPAHVWRAEHTLMAPASAMTQAGCQMGHCSLAQPRDQQNYELPWLLHLWGTTPQKPWSKIVPQQQPFSRDTGHL